MKKPLGEIGTPSKRLISHGRNRVAHREAGPKRLQRHHTRDALGRCQGTLKESAHADPTFPSTSGSSLDIHALVRSLPNG
jgi:hypothetical protein